MKTLYLDCFAGISGDMTIGALLDLGLDFEYLRQELAKLGVTGYELSLERVDRSGISAAKFDVHLHNPVHVHHHHDHHHDHPHSHEEHHHDHRSLSTIKHLIAASALSEQVKQNATAIFERIGAAEAKIHGVDIESVHFHEVGAVDSIVDIVGACIGIEGLGIQQILSSPLHVGYGTFTCAHGIYPIPGPAATEILCGVPIYANNIKGELVTPTGAAIVATLAKDFAQMPLMRVEKVGYGAGTRVYEKFPNVLRAVLGEIEAQDTTPDTITVIEANLDDLNPQIFGHVMEQALAAGALDIFYTPVQMKKNRPGVLLTLLCATEARDNLIDLIFRETTTLGVRYREERRVILRREFVTVETPFGPITIKVARSQTGQVMNAAPEFADCQAAALKHQVALRTVQLAALNAYQ
ncbi:MAG TPA: nickel pincer cofactor biosynthesis protein LarC [Blastocatellia bacterium]|nr:nickel pincer cofactor biosynthesis protein LarC [Blastocatellia bacterium]